MSIDKMSREISERVGHGRNAGSLRIIREIQEHLVVVLMNMPTSHAFHILDFHQVKVVDEQTTGILTRGIGWLADQVVARDAKDQQLIQGDDFRPAIIRIIKASLKYMSEECRYYSAGRGPYAVALCWERVQERRG